MTSDTVRNPVQKPLQLREIVETFPDLLNLVRGTNDAFFSDIQTGTTASHSSLIFISNLEQLREASNSRAKTWVVSTKLIDQVPASVENVLSSQDAYLALAKVAQKYFRPQQAFAIVSGNAIHPTAVIAESAKLGEGCRIAPGAVIGENVSLGARCFIGANCVIEPGVMIGDDSKIHPLVFVAHGCVIGQRCEIKPHTCIGGEGFGYAHDASITYHRVTHFGRVVIGDDVHIGAGVQIDRGTFEDSRIENGAKIDNHCHFGHNITVGRNTVITASMVTAGSTKIGANCVFGGRVTIKGHLQIVDGCQFAGITAVGNNVSQRGEYGGFPMQRLRDDMRTRASIKDLTRTVKRVKQIFKHLGLSD